MMGNINFLVLLSMVFAIYSLALSDESVPSKEGILIADESELPNQKIIPKEKLVPPQQETVAIVSRQDMRERGIKTTNQLIEEIIIGLYPAYTTSNAHDHLNPKILFMLDGRDIIGDTYAGSYPYFQKINLKYIHHVEILSGPNISRFGGGPYIGIVNIVLRSMQPQPGKTTQPATILKF